MGGDAQRRLVTGGGTGVFVLAALLYFDQVGWWRKPALGLPLVILIGVAGAVPLTALTTALQNRRVLYAALSTVGLGVVAWFAFHGWIVEPTYPRLFLMLGVSLAVAVLMGRLWGGWDRRVASWVSVGSALGFALATAGDQLLRNWGLYLEAVPLGRPIKTIGSGTPNFEGPFWTSVWDWGTQLILPTVVVTVISLATYSRFTQASMLDAVGQDYIRTARSKGLSERVVVTKHALRNALIPITTIVAFNFAGLIGGAVVTETVFGWKGMGALFIEGLNRVDPGPVMAFYVVTGTAAVLMNLAADIAYAFLDPRIRT